VWCGVERVEVDDVGRWSVYDAKNDKILNGEKKMKL
jgi:hypothetical protein